MEFYKKMLYNTNKEIYLLYKPQYIFKIFENETLVPRFKLKDDIFSDFPINTPMKYNHSLIMKAIEYGMILQIDYKGKDDKEMGGHERTIYPMVIGKTKDENVVIRGYHLVGWSVNKGGSTEKEWRMFRADRILNIVFTGAFFRLPPDGYNMDDKGIKDIIKAANFEEIRKLQQKLLSTNNADTFDKTILKKVNTIEVKDLNHNLKIFNPWEHNVIPKKDAKNIRITFAKPNIGKGSYIAIIGTSIEPNVTFKLKQDSNVDLGTYKSVKWIMGNELDLIKNIEQQVEFKTYIFIKGI